MKNRVIFGLLLALLAFLSPALAVPSDLKVKPDNCYVSADVQNFEVVSTVSELPSFSVDSRLGFDSNSLHPLSAFTIPSNRISVCKRVAFIYSTSGFANKKESRMLKEQLHRNSNYPICNLKRIQIVTFAHPSCN
jgi:hypothetical protein